MPGVSINLDDQAYAIYNSWPKQKLKGVHPSRSGKVSTAICDWSRGDRKKKELEESVKILEKEKEYLMKLCEDAGVSTHE